MVGSKIIKKVPKVIAVTGGKGGVGKSTVTLNLSILLSQMGFKVALFDADLGLANINLMLGIKVTNTIQQVLSGECHLEDIFVRWSDNLTVIPSASGVQSLADADSIASRNIMDAFDNLLDQFDYLLIDTAAGISNQVLSFSAASDETIVVACDEPASLSDAYAVIKLLNQNRGVKRFYILANMLSKIEEGKSVYARLSNLCDRFLQVNLKYLGGLPRDKSVNLATKLSKPVVEHFPSAKVSVCMIEMAHKLVKQTLSDSRIREINTLNKNRTLTTSIGISA